MSQSDGLRGPFGRMPLDTTAIRQDRLNIDGKERSNLFPWSGQFSPQLVEVLLRTYAGSGDLVLDPFLGSGTVLCEAGRRGHPCFGTEINPAAFKMAQTYQLINVHPDQRKAIVKDVDARLHEVLPEPLPLLARGDGDPDVAELRQALTDLSSGLPAEAGILIDALIVLLDFYKSDLTADKAFNTWARLKATIKALPFRRRRSTFPMPTQGTCCSRMPPSTSC